jgi:hypothetical protein
MTSIILKQFCAALLLGLFSLSSMASDGGGAACEGFGPQTPRDINQEVFFRPELQKNEPV